VFGAAGVGAAFAPSFATLLAMRLLQGVGSAGLINLAVVLLGDYWEGTERARLIGYNAAVLTVSVAVFPAVGGVLAQVGGWRWSFAPYALAIGTAVAVWLLLPQRPTPAPIPMSRQVRDAVAVLRMPVVFGAVAFGFVLFVLIFGLFLTAMPILLEDDFGLDAGVRGLILAFPATGSTLAAVTLGRTRSRLGARRLLLISSMLFVVGFTTIGLANVLVLLFAGALLYGLGEGASIPTVQDLVAGAAPEASRGAVVAAWVGAARAGQTLGPLVAGVGLDAVGPSTTFVIGGAVSAVLLVVQLVVRLDRIAARRLEAAAVTSGP
jgi:MFS family permease